MQNCTLTPKAISEELADKVNSFDRMAENHDGLIVECDGDSTVSSEWSFNMTPKEDVTNPFGKFSDNDSDLNDDDSDDIIPNLADISSASSKDTFPSIISHVASSPKDTQRARPTPTPTTTFFMTSIKEVRPRQLLLVLFSGSPVVDSVITRSPTLPSRLAVAPPFNFPNNLLTLSDLEHRNLDYI
ncbi:hypothetical protein D6D29_05825 [Aureobasidium pullulans]|nr:hypothetical protein D6D29_05825 [Aureobasidium pullulans]